MVPDAVRQGFEVDLSISKMQALIYGGMDNFLVHGLMRLLKKSQVTVGFDHPDFLFDHKFYRTSQSLVDKVRIISNGKKAVAMRL